MKTTFALLALGSISGCGGQILTPDGADASEPEALTSIGDPCSHDAECPGHTGEPGIFGQGPFCAKSHAGVPLPGGYCSARCATAADCGDRSASVVCGVARYDEVDGGAGAVCLRACDPAIPGSCRAGYACVEVTGPGAGTTFGCSTSP
jgi:hypothetical protein